MLYHKDMQIEHIQSFLLLCKEKNISKCSKELHISQQGLSRQIKAMEHELQTTLFIRTTKGVEPTKDAYLLQTEFELALKHYKLGLSKLQKSLSVSVCPGIKQAFGLNLFHQFQAENPSISLHLKFQSDIDCENALFNDEVDAAFLDWPIHKEQYNTYLMVKSPLVAVMRKNHPLATNTFIRMQDLKGMDIYIPDESHRMSQKFRQEWPQFYNQVHIDFTTNEYDSFYTDLPKAYGGIALTFQFLCTNLDPDLIAIPIQEESFVELYYCTKKGHPNSLALQTFTNYIKKK